MRGKYSPTVSAAYREDQEWYRKFCASATGGENDLLDTSYDPEGFDSYGYNKDDIDRAGNAEWEYYANDDDEDFFGSGNKKYDKALWDWGFDGQKPIIKG